MWPETSHADAHGAHAAHGDHEEEHEEAEDTKEEEAPEEDDAPAEEAKTDDAPAEEAKDDDLEDDDSEKKAHKAGEDVKSEDAKRGDVQSNTPKEGESQSKTTSDGENMPESKGKVEGVQFKGKSSAGDDDNEVPDVRHREPDSKGAFKKRIDSAYGKNLGEGTGSVCIELAMQKNTLTNVLPRAPPHSQHRVTQGLLTPSKKVFQALLLDTRARLIRIQKSPKRARVSLRQPSPRVPLIPRGHRYNSIIPARSKMVVNDVLLSLEPGKFKKAIELSMRHFEPMTKAPAVAAVYNTCVPLTCSLASIPGLDMSILNMTLPIQREFLA